MAAKDVCVLDETIVPPSALVPGQYSVPSTGLAGGADVVVITTRYRDGAGTAGVNEPVTEVTHADNESAVGWVVGVMQGAGGFAHTCISL